jgi:hypothetical protein
MHTKRTQRKSHDSAVWAAARTAHGYCKRSAERVADLVRGKGRAALMGPFRQARGAQQARRAHRPISPSAEV